MGRPKISNPWTQSKSMKLTSLEALHESKHLHLKARRQDRWRISCSQSQRRRKWGETWAWPSNTALMLLILSCSKRTFCRRTRMTSSPKMTNKRWKSKAKMTLAWVATRRMHLTNVNGTRKEKKPIRDAYSKSRKLRESCKSSRSWLKKLRHWRQSFQWTLSLSHRQSHSQWWMSKRSSNSLQGRLKLWRQSLQMINRRTYWLPSLLYQQSHPLLELALPCLRISRHLPPNLKWCHLKMSRINQAWKLIIMRMLVVVDLRQFKRDMMKLRTQIWCSIEKKPISPKNPINLQTVWTPSAVTLRCYSRIT